MFFEEKEKKEGEKEGPCVPRILRYQDGTVIRFANRPYGTGLRDVTLNTINDMDVMDKCRELIQRGSREDIVGQIIQPLLVLREIQPQYLEQNNISITRIIILLLNRGYFIEDIITHFKITYDIIKTLGRKNIDKLREVYQNILLQRQYYLEGKMEYFPPSPMLAEALVTDKRRKPYISLSDNDDLSLLHPKVTVETASLKVFFHSLYLPLTDRTSTENFVRAYLMFSIDSKLVQDALKPDETNPNQVIEDLFARILVPAEGVTEPTPDPYEKEEDLSLLRDISKIPEPFLKSRLKDTSESSEDSYSEEDTSEISEDSYSADTPKRSEDSSSEDTLEKVYEIVRMEKRTTRFRPTTRSSHSLHSPSYKHSPRKRTLPRPPIPKAKTSNYIPPRHALERPAVLPRIPEQRSSVPIFSWNDSDTSDTLEDSPSITVRSRRMKRSLPKTGLSNSLHSPSYEHPPHEGTLLKPLTPQPESRQMPPSPTMQHTEPPITPPNPYQHPPLPADFLHFEKVRNLIWKNTSVSQIKAEGFTPEFICSNIQNTYCSKLINILKRKKSDVPEYDNFAWEIQRHMSALE